MDRVAVAGRRKVFFVFCKYHLVFMLFFDGHSVRDVEYASRM
mgnify:FL=1